MELKDYNDAITQFSYAIEIKDNYTEAYLNKADAEIKSAKTQNACLDLNKAKELGDKEAEKLIKKFCNTK